MPRPNLGPEFSKCSDAETKTSRAFSALVAPGPIPSNFEKKDLRIWNIEFNGKEIIFALHVWTLALPTGTSTTLQSSEERVRETR